MCLARCKREPNRQAIGIDHRMNLAGQSASRPAQGLSLVPGDTGGVLMHADYRRIDHSHGCVMRGGQRVENSKRPAEADASTLILLPLSEAQPTWRDPLLTSSR